MTSRGQGVPVVAHVMRGCLARTETFIANQMLALRDFRPIMLCHHRVSGLPLAGPEVFAAADMLRRPWRDLDQLLYRGARLASGRGVRALARSAASRQARLLHFHYLVDARFFLALKAETGLPAMVSAYGYDVSQFPHAYRGYGRHYLQPVFEALDCFVAMSEDMRRDLIDLGCPPDKVVVHYHGINTTRFAFPERAYDHGGPLTILACGTLEIKKAQDLTLAALRLVEEQGLAARPFRVVLAGDGPLRGQLEQQVAGYGWQDRVTFLGHVPHDDPRLVATYHDADIFSLPSITVRHDKEGIPGTIVEAMASGLPVVATYHAGIPEVIGAGRDGLLVHERDVPALARAFAQLLDDSNLRRRLGRAAARRALAELDLQPKTRELERLYCDLLEP